MNILFLCISMRGRHGSALHTLEYAEYFSKKGDSVTIATLDASEENIEKAFEYGVEIVHIGNLKDIKWDIVYAFHLLLFPGLLFAGLKCDKVISMSLSASLPIEQLPPSSFWPQYDLITTLSEEGVANAKINFNIDGRIYTIIPNHLPIQFKEKSTYKNSWNPQIERVCVISNHHVEEVVELQNYAQFQVDYYGVKYGKSVEITPDLLLQCDAIITIGKTAHYGMGLGVPLFEYDRFGGCGFLGVDNILDEEKTNFSGKGTKTKITGAQLEEALISGYAKTWAEADAL